jgi:glycerol-3-phosphate dehydrogenase (NAD(P)+)
VSVRPRAAVLGAGAWGTALASHIARRHPVTLWLRDPALAAQMNRQRENAKYLPGVQLSDAIAVQTDLPATLSWLAQDDASGHEALVVVATSVAGLRPTLQALARAWPAAPEKLRLIWLCKGIEQGSDRLPHQIVADVLPQAVGAPLCGPSFAQELARQLPAALALATRDDALAALAVRVLHFDALRIYRSHDVLGVELGAALKNVVAIATGICDGLQLGLNARAALITRGLAEISRLGVAMGASAQTFMGLTGLGDLVLTCTGELSRNRRVGLELAAGHRLTQVLQGLGHVAEGVACVHAALALAHRFGVELPIAQAVEHVLGGQLQPAQAVAALLAREPRKEI